MYPSAARCVARADFPILLPTENFVEPLLLHNEGDFRRSLHTAPFTYPFLDEAVMVLGVAFVPFVDFWVDITSGLRATSSSLCFEAGRAERCSR